MLPSEKILQTRKEPEAERIFDKNETKKLFYYADTLSFTAQPGS
jgi:hypothetical protein